MLDYIRIACAVPPVCVGDVKKNTADICRQIAEADEKGSDLVVFPELAITGYTCGDLFLQEALLSAAKGGLTEIVRHTEDYPAVTAVVGLPLRLGGGLFNCAAVVSDGIIRGIVPKAFLANPEGFSESRWFESGKELNVDEIEAKEIGLSEEYEIPVGRDLVFTLGDGASFGVEICQDLWSPIPPSTYLAMGGAEVIVNLSASNETAGKTAQRRRLVCHQSEACACIYAFASAGYGESTGDTVFSGHSLIGEKGKIIQESPKGLQSGYLMVADGDLGKIRSVRRKDKGLQDAAAACDWTVRQVFCQNTPLRGNGSLANISKLPFVPDNREDRIARCREVFEIQARGLARRLETIGANAVIGISGGLDSTLALLVAVEAMAMLDRPATDIHGITMPCFGTTDRTYGNALCLMTALGITQKEIPIRAAVQQHFADIGQDENKFDATYENAQARERTQILMDYAGIHKGIVVGTGDLSELALGWCTYNGDHMSMYGVNATVPKTLIRWMIEALAEMPRFADARAVLLDILDTPISPELLPPDAKGKIAQYTEDLVGPYALHDFFLYYMVGYQFAPEKIYAMACRAFEKDFDCATVKKWLVVFYRRFFTQQFKRSCMPDGAKVGSISFSPRGDFRMPSDACGKLWIEAAEKL